MSSPQDEDARDDAMAGQGIGQLKARAAAGDAGAMFELGVRYYPYNPVLRLFRKPVVAEDATEALAWYGRAAARGHRAALHALALMHEHGKGTEVDLVKALDYYRQAQERGRHCEDSIARVEAAIAADPALRAAQAAAAANAAPVDENVHRQRLALEQDAVRLQEEEARLQRERAVLDADRARHAQEAEQERAMWTAEKGREQQRVAQERAAWNVQKAREQHALARERAVLDAERARLQHRERAFQRERDAVDAANNQREAQQRAKQAAAAAFAQAKQKDAAAKQAEILAGRHAKDSSYVRDREAVVDAWTPTKVKLAECPVHARPLAPGQSVLLEQCLHAICRDCAPHMLQPPDNASVCCPICKAVSPLARDGTTLPHHPFVEAELAAGAAHVCTMCLSDPEEERLPAAATCTTCNPEKRLCDPHASLHRARQPTHAITPLPHGGAALRCGTHSDKPMEAYCTRCRELICVACALSTHQGHAARLLTDTAFVDGVRQRLVEGVTAVRTVAEALVDHAADATVAVTEVEARDAAIRSEVDRAIHVLIGLLERRRAAMHEQIDAQSQQERGALQQTRDESAHAWRIVTSAADLAEQLAVGTHLGVNATAVMVQLEAAATARLQAVLGLAPARAVPAPAVLRFHLDELVGKQLALLGEIVRDAD